jgi:hypothetical protein
MVIVLDAHEAITPAGKLLPPETPEFEIPVAPVVVSVIGVKAELIQTVGVDEATPAVLAGVIVTIPEPLTLEQLVILSVIVTL